MSNACYPNIRFPEFSQIWSTETWGTIYGFYPTNSLSREKMNYDEGKVKNIHYGDIHTKFDSLFDISRENVPFIKSNIETKNFKNCELGDLIIADASENYDDVGKSIEIFNLDGEQVVAGLHTLHARPKPNRIAIGFGAYTMASPYMRNQIRLIAQGTKVLGISSNRINALKIHLPSLPEQEKIVSLFSSLDTKIGQLNRKKMLLDDYKKGCVQQLFSQTVRFKTDNGNEYPVWERKSVSEVFTVTRGDVLAVSKMTQNADRKSKFPVYSSQTKSNGLTGYYTEYLYSDAITWTTDGANAGDVKYRSGKFYCTNVCGVLISKNGYANACVAEMLNQVTRNYVSYVGNPKLMNNVMASIEIEFPHPDEQRKIAEFLVTIDRKIELVSIELEKAKLFKKGLLQQMFI